MSADKYSVYFTRADGRGSQLFASSERLAAAQANYRLKCADPDATMVWITELGKSQAVELHMPDLPA